MSRGDPSSQHPVRFDDEQRQALYDVIAHRRDVRNFTPERVSEEVLHRVLCAAHQAPSVGFMQPWDFILVREEKSRRRAYDTFRRANDRAVRHFADDRAVAYAALKLQGVLDAPLGICVTCDTRRGGPHVLGRDTMPETDRYSTCLAIENLWLAARSEGLGVGWVSIVEPADLVELFELPEGVLPIAYLCIGYPVTFSPEPMLATTGWRQRLPLAEVIREETWTGVRELLEATSPSPQTAVKGEEGTLSIEERLTALCLQLARDASPPHIGVQVRDRLDALAKPVGSLGTVERLAVRLAEMQRTARPRVQEATLLLFAGDHGVTRQSVSAFLPEVTTKLCYNVIAGGAVANALAREMNVDIKVVDVGVDHDFDAATALAHRKVRRGTRDLAVEPSLTAAEVLAAIEAGMDVVNALPDGVTVLLGEVGIGNTTSAAAVSALLLGCSVDDVVGRGTGIGTAMFERKSAAVAHGVARARGAYSSGALAEPLAVLAEVGGLEIAAMVGAILAAAGRHLTVVLDGMIVSAAALCAAAMAPNAVSSCIAAHCGSEPAHALILDRLKLEPLLQLELRLGEGTGALLCLPLLRSACRLLSEVRTWEEAGVEVPYADRMDS